MNLGRFNSLRQQFIHHTRAELQQFHASLPTAQQGDVQALAVLKHVMHRIHGSGAMLGFSEISTQAAGIEQILRRAEGMPETIDWQVIAQRADHLASALHAAEQQRKSDDQSPGT